jgi:hypothetical protein
MIPTYRTPSKPLIIILIMLRMYANLITKTLVYVIYQWLIAQYFEVGIYMYLFKI